MNSANRLGVGDASARLQAVLLAGTAADPALVDALLERSAVEPDFFVRDMVTWALVRLPKELTVPRLVEELRSERAQARSQALHTLSKIGDPETWPSITPELLRDPDDEVARSAWRTAVGLVPAGQEAALAKELAQQLGRGSREVRLSLSQAMVRLGEVIEPILQDKLAGADAAVREHAVATERLLRDPEAGFQLATDEAKKVVALSPEQVR